MSSHKIMGVGFQWQLLDYDISCEGYITTLYALEGDESSIDPMVA